ncbi:MAG: hypothetical protein PHN88_02060 [Ignavibacteria bacterium]|nr:hypothetical protein [Ignavibacteria bacterium]
MSYLIKYNSNGDSLWTYSSKDYVIESMPDNENNILIAGGNKLKKISPEGLLVWDKTMPKYIHASNLTKDLIGNYCLCGEFMDTLYFYKISSSGELLWSKYFKKYYVGNYYFYNSQRCILTKDGNILLGFETPNAIKSDITLMKYKPSGDLIWERKYSYADTSEQFLIELKEDSRGFVYVCGFSRKNNLPITQRDDYFVTLKYNPDGKLIRATRKEGLPTYSGIPKCFTIDSYDKLYLACEDETANNFYSATILAKFSQPYEIHYLFRFQPDIISLRITRILLTSKQSSDSKYQLMQT